MKKIAILLLFILVFSCDESNPDRLTDKVMELQTVNLVTKRALDSSLSIRKTYIPG